MVTKRFDTMLLGLSVALAIGMLAVGCSAPPPPTFDSTGGAALSDSDYKSIINDPATNEKDWKSADPVASGIAYWHVGWVSNVGSEGTPVEYVLATGYDRVTQKEVVEVVIPQTANDLAYEFHSLPGAPKLDVDKLTPDVEAISEGLATVLSTTDGPDRGSSQCARRTSSYRRPKDLRSLRRCSVGGSYPSSGAATGASPPAGDDIVVVLNILLDVAQSVQEIAHCDSDVRSLDDDYRLPSADAEWREDCSSGGATGARRSDGATGRTVGSSCPEVGKVCFSPDGSQRGTCGADHKCWQR